MIVLVIQVIPTYIDCFVLAVALHKCFWLSRPSLLTCIFLCRGFLLFILLGLFVPLLYDCISMKVHRMKNVLLVAFFCRSLGIWCRICSVARRAQQANKWAAIGCQFTCEWHWTSHSCGQCCSTFWWHIQVERHCRQGWCLPHPVRNVEDTCRKVFYVDWWLPLIWSP